MSSESPISRPTLVRVEDVKTDGHIWKVEAQNNGPLSPTTLGLSYNALLGEGWRDRMATIFDSPISLVALESRPWPGGLQPKRKSKIKTMGNNNFDDLLSLVDWNLQRRKPYVVVDPFDPTAILYMTDKEYQVLLRTALSNNESLVVVCRPGSKPPQDSQGSNDGTGSRQRR